ncbi:MAG: DUF1510 family protein [Tuberibacillus sp.]
MPKKDDFGLSRSSRKKEQRFDRFLNWAIAIVVVCILAVGGYLLVSILNSPDQPAANAHKTTATKANSADKEKASKDNSNKEDNQAEKDDSDTTDSASSDDNSTTSPEDDGTADTGSGSYDTSQGGPQGPWHPIGTQQAEPHQNSYDMGSVDWNEKVKALAYATGIPEDQMTVKWLGNGGAPDRSLGKVYSKQDPSKVYDVVIQWVTNEGWQPISINVE